jgi:hypothetical protein
MRRSDGRPRVLLVDDYPDAREMYGEYLEYSGYEVIEAANGVEALQRAVDDKPDIILMDLSLPVMDGWEATRRLKADERTARIPAVTPSSPSPVCPRISSCRFGGCSSTWTPRKAARPRDPPRMPGDRGRRAPAASRRRPTPSRELLQRLAGALDGAVPPGRLARTANESPANTLYAGASRERPTAAPASTSTRGVTA